MALIVVGVDGSEGSDAALRFAAAEAALRGAKLRAVCAWEIPSVVYATTWGVAADEEPTVRGRAQDILGGALSEVERLEPGIDSDSRAVHGQPADVLVQESQDADLLVVGSRGFGGFKRLMLGSVSQQVAHHASCPVVIVPSPEHRTPESDQDADR